METIEDRYVSLHPTSSALYAEAVTVFPSGVTHDLRYTKPFPIFVERASGSRKWDVDGNEYVDYVVGHGALLLGHGRPEVVAAVSDQMARGTHHGAEHSLVLEWGKWVQRLVLSAEMVKFVSSGTEATHLATRLARAHTGKDKILKFEGHFHGWHDYVTAGVTPPFDVPSSVGVPKSVLDTVLVVPPDFKEAEKVIYSRDDIAGVIIEPTGASWGRVPLKPGFLADLRDLTAHERIVLIFDEIVSGFRVAPGGAQQLFGIRPDLTTLAKILAGGLPGGAVVGKAEIMERMEFRDDPQWNRYLRVSHPGTFNGNPLSSAAGIAALSIVSQGEVLQTANRTAQLLRDGFNRLIEGHRVHGCVYGTHSMFHIFLGRECPISERCDRERCEFDPTELKKGTPAPIGGALRNAMRNEGVDLFGTSGMTSSAHNLEDVDATLAAFDASLGQMVVEGLLATR